MNIANIELFSNKIQTASYIFEFAKNRMPSVAFAGSGRYIQGASIGVNVRKRIFVDLTYAKVSPMQMYALQGGATIKCLLTNRGYTVGESDVCKG